MNTKQVVAVAILVLVVLALIIGLFVGDATNTTVLRVGDKKYDISDFVSYVKAWNYDDDSSKSDINTMFSNYESYKVYSTRAEKAGVTLSGDEVIAELSSGDYATMLADYDLTSGEYMRVKTEMALANKLYASPYELGKISKSYFDSYKASMIEENGENYFDTYDYRVIEVTLAPEIEVEDENAEVVNDEASEVSGDVVGSCNASGETSGDKARKEQQRKDEAKAKAELVLNVIKEYASNKSGDNEAYISRLRDALEVQSGDEEFSGDVFDYIGQFEESSRYTQNSNGFMSVANAELTSASKLYFKEDLTGTNSYLSMFGYDKDAKEIVDKVTNLKAGEVSDIFESVNGYSFVYLENIRSGLDEADELRYNNELANTYIGQNANMTFNKTLVNKLKLDEILPIKAREAQAPSGDIVSGEVVDAEVSTEEVDGNSAEPTVAIEEVTSGEEVSE